MYSSQKVRLVFVASASSDKVVLTTSELTEAVFQAQMQNLSGGGTEPAVPCRSSLGQ